MLLVFSESKVYAGEALVLGDTSFIILLSSAWTSDIFSKSKNMYFYIGFPWEQIFSDDFVFYYLFTVQPIKCADLHLWKEYPFHVSDFNWSFNQAAIKGLG